MKKAVWIIGHGSSKKEWVEQVDQEIARVNTDLPIIISFLEKVEGRLIINGIEKLKEIGAWDVLVIPLFVSSASTHIAEIKSILSTYEDNFKFSYSSCMDDHDFVIEHIVQEANILTKSAKNNEDYTLLLIGHGSDEPQYQEMWQQILKNIVHKLDRAIGSELKLKHIEFATFLPYTIENKLKDIERNKWTGHTLIVIPLFLSTGVFTNKKIPKILSNYSTKYHSVAYLNPSIRPWIHQWIKFQIAAFQKH